MLLNFSTPPNPQRRASLAKRRGRLQLMHASVERAHQAFTELPGGIRPDELRLRNGFSFRFAPAGEESSDRRVPPRRERPPATRISSSRGAALRLELTAIAAAQRFRAGARNRNPLPLPSTGPSGWTSLIASPAQTTGGHRWRMNTVDKKERTLRTALATLKGARLVQLSNEGAGRGKHTDFQLLDECALEASAGESLPYEVPRQAEPTFSLPMTFITNDWVHLLEDSEIALLLMVACGLGATALEENKQGFMAVEANVRLLHYGISRDAFEAHLMLSSLGLLTVLPEERHEDSRAIEFKTKGAALHRLRLERDAFDRPAHDALVKALDHELSR
jgi:hypothetical protein